VLVSTHSLLRDRVLRVLRRGSGRLRPSRSGRRDPVRLSADLPLPGHCAVAFGGITPGQGDSVQVLEDVDCTTTGASRPTGKNASPSMLTFAAQVETVAELSSGVLSGDTGLTARFKIDWRPGTYSTRKSSPRRRGATPTTSSSSGRTSTRSAPARATTTTARARP
jgi:hypothetical protein